MKASRQPLGLRASTPILLAAILPSESRETSGLLHGAAKVEVVPSWAW